jgi:hypothetical protein
MPFRDEKHSLPSIETIETDAEAETRLPPYAIVRTSYTSYRAEGLPPREALRQTLALWQEFQESARPSTYKKTQKQAKQAD